MKKNKGITLIALVVTMIVLLILAGVSLSLIMGNEGILNRATSSVVEHNKAKAQEKLELVLADLSADKFTNKDYNTTDFINKRLINAGISISEADENKVIVDGWEFEVDRTVPQIVSSIGQAPDEILPDQGEDELPENNLKEVEIDDELAALLAEANMTITLEDVLNTPAIMNEVNGLIPTLTEEDVAREEIDGVITYTDSYGGITRTNSEHSDGRYNAWKSFDNNVATDALSKQYEAENYYVEYEFPQQVYAMQIKYIFTNGSSAEGTRKFVIQGYDEEKAEWKDLTEELAWTGTGVTEIEDTENLEYTKTYKKYRLYVKTATYTSNSCGDDISGLSSMQLYGVASLEIDKYSDENLKRALLANSNLQKITLNHMVSNTEFTKRLINALSIETVTNNETLMANLPELIPTLTESDVTRSEEDGIVVLTTKDGDVISAKSELDTTNHKLVNVFDKNNTTGTLSKYGEANGYYLEYEFNQKMYAMQIKFKMADGTKYHGTRKVVIQGYDEQNEKWEDLTEELIITETGDTYDEVTENLDYTKSYKRYRFYVNEATATSNSAGSVYSGLYEMQFYGKKAN